MYAIYADQLGGVNGTYTSLAETDYLPDVFFLQLNHFFHPICLRIRFALLVGDKQNATLHFLRQLRRIGKVLFPAARM